MLVIFCAMPFVVGCTTENNDGESVHVHSFDRKFTSEEYLAREATCIEKALYYYSCICGAKGEETFETGSYKAHNYTDLVDAKYLKTEATCISKAVYYRSCSVCGVASTATFTVGEVKGHTFIENPTVEYRKTFATCTAKATYFYSCSVCGVEDTNTFEYGDLLPHTFTSEEASSKYLHTPATCTAKATYFYSCAVCGLADANNTFESGNLLDHSYTKEIPTADYLRREATCTAKARYWYACATCDLKSQSVSYEYGEFDMTNHSSALFNYSSNGDGTHAKTHRCCGLFDSNEDCSGGTATCVAKAQCEHCYTTYGEIDLNNHISTSYEYISNNDYATHAKRHTCCHTVEINENCSGGEATCTERAICSVCGGEYGEPKGHSFSTEWTYDNTYHWHVATCEHIDEISDKSEHTYENGRCTVCGRLEVFTITYVLGGGTNSENNPDTYTTTMTIILELPTRLGYTATGWKDSDSDTVITQIDSGSVGNKTLTAVWSPDVILADNGATVTGKNNNVTDLVILSIYDGYTKEVTKINDSAFYGDTTLTSVTLPDTLKTLRSQAFYGCSSLTSIIIPDRVDGIRGQTFDGCISLTSIVIGSGVETISDLAFYGCNALTTVYYHGDETAWGAINIYSGGNTTLINATRYYYSESEPNLDATGTAYNGNYWHYVDGVVTIWKKN